MRIEKELDRRSGSFERIGVVLYQRTDSSSQSLRTVCSVNSNRDSDGKLQRGLSQLCHSSCSAVITKNAVTNLKVV